MLSIPIHTPETDAIRDDVLRKARMTAAIETLLKEEIHTDCRRYLRGMYLEMTNGKGSV